MNIVPVAVIIPTYNRGLAVLAVLDKIQRCDPSPAEIWIHIDSADGRLEGELIRRFPNIKLLTSPTRLGPGGGRHRCLLACNTPYAVSFDDDSYPVDSDFFCRVEQLFSQRERAAIFGATIWHRYELAKPRRESLVITPSYIGCGYAIRLAAYRQIRGYLPRRVPYGMEETDLSLQLFASGWRIYEAGDLRVFHDSDLKHHQSPEITSGIITNVALFAFLNYPFVCWGWGFVQLLNIVSFCIRMGRLRGICSGIFRIPADCYMNRRYRSPIPLKSLIRYIRFCRSDQPSLMIRSTNFARFEGSGQGS